MRLQGFLRMDEAMDCPDLDSVHNDYQRHLPCEGGGRGGGMQHSD